MTSDLLYLCKLVILKFQPVAHINAKGQQSDGNLGNYAGIVIADECVVSPNVDHNAKHILSSLRNPPLFEPNQ